MEEMTREEAILKEILPHRQKLVENLQVNLIMVKVIIKQGLLF